MNDGGYPSPSRGYPSPGQGVPPWVRSGQGGIPQDGVPPRPGQDGVFPQERSGWGAPQDGVTSPRSGHDGVPPPGQDRTAERTFAMRGWYASCIHAEGLSCFFIIL